MSSLTSTLVARSRDVQEVDNFYQGCSFSPDGLCVLSTTVRDSKLRLYNTVHAPANGTEHEGFQGDLVAVIDWTTALVAQGRDAVRSYAWYPKMASSDPATCCFLATCRDQPVHLFDAYSGAIRATYRPYNALDEIESPSVVEFSPDGQKIWTGGFRTDRFIHIFDLARPGRDSTVLKLGKTRRSSDGQKGLVSAMTGAPDSRVFCVGTYAPGSIYVYDDRSSQTPSGTILNGVCVVGHGRGHARKKRRFVAMEEGDGGAEDPEAIFSQARVNWFQSRAQGGVTQLKFSLDHEYQLYSASRRSNAILSWDLRMVSGNPDYQSQPIRGIRSFSMSGNTNQRIQFDLDGRTSRLFVGGVDCSVKCYETKSGDLLGTIGDGLFDQAVNGVSFHPGFSAKGLLATATGSRNFPSEEDLENDTMTCTKASPGQLHLFSIND